MKVTVKDNYAIVKKGAGDIVVATNLVGGIIQTTIKIMSEISNT